MKASALQAPLIDAEKTREFRKLATGRLQVEYKMKECFFSRVFFFVA